MRKTVATILATLALVSMSSAPFAQNTPTPQGTQKQAPSQEQVKAYLDTLLQKIAQEPDNLQLNFEYATLARRAGLYDEAAAAYERMLIQKPDLPRVKLDLALTYMHMKNYTRAEALFEDVLKTNPPETVQNNINNMLAQIGAAQKNHRLTGNIGFGYSSDSNANASSNSGNVLVFDVLVPVGAGGGEDADETIFSTASVNHSYTFNHQKGYSWDSSFSAYKTEQMSLDSLDLTVFNYKTGPTFTLPNKKTKLKFEAAYSNINLAHQKYLQVASLQTGFETVLHPKVKLSGYAKIENRDFTNSRTVTTYEDKDGKAREFNINALTIATPKDIVNLGVTHRREDTNTLYNNNTQNSLQVAYTRILPKNMFLNTSYTAKNTQYKGVDVLVSPTIVRKDHTRTLSALIGKKFEGNWTVSANYQYIEATSNLVNYEYENEKIMLSASKQFGTTW